jgi:D-threo-aldose 1-dehydrogenase
MVFEPTERVPLGRTDVSVTRLAFGTAEIGGLYHAVAESDATSLLAHAWDAGVRYFDTAPLYGYGTGEQRLGAVLGLHRGDRRSTTVSTKVGRLLVPIDAVPADADIDHQSDGVTDNAFYVDTPPVRVIFDYSGDGIRRSLDASLRRLRLERIDIAYIHDPDDHWHEAIDGAYPALHRLREQGVVRAIGAGMNHAEMLARFARETDMDVFLLASRYTLLDQSALDELLPTCAERGMSVVIGGVMNTGLLADPRAGTRYDYRAAPPDLIDRAQRLRAICERHDVPLRAAAIQFPLAHPAVAALVTGVRSPEHFDDYPRFMRMTIAADLWAELRAEGFIAPGAPVPA